MEASSVEREEESVTKTRFARWNGVSWEASPVTDKRAVICILDDARASFHRRSTVLVPEQVRAGE